VIVVFFLFGKQKNIATGEGGMLVTNDENIAQVARMVRNHGEMILESMKKRTYTSNILGWGYRMTELEAAIGVEQLKKLDDYNNKRNLFANIVTKELNSIDGLEHIKKEYVEHAYYLYGFTFNQSKFEFTRDNFVKAINAEGIPMMGGYVKPLYLNPVYHDSKPYIYTHYTGKARYEKGLCPITEQLYEKELVFTPILRPPITEKDIQDVISVINKVIDNQHEFKSNENKSVN